MGRMVTSLLLLLCLPVVYASDELVGATSAESLMDAGHYKRARVLVGTSLRVNPNDAYARFLESKIKQSFGDLPGAMASAERAVALEPHNADFHAQLAEVSAFTADISSWFKGVSFVRQMKREIGEALSLKPNDTDALLVLMMFSLRAPKVVGGDKRKAYSIAAEIKQHDPRWGYLAEARLLENSGDDAKLEGLLQQAVRADPTHYRALFELARFYCSVAIHKDFAAAERTARNAMKIDPARAGAYDILARVCASQHRWLELDALLAQSEKAVPDDLAPYYQAANILVRDSADPARAATYLRRYLSQEPEGREPTQADAQALANAAGHAITSTR